MAALSILILALGAGLIGLQLTRTSRLGGEAIQQIEQLVEGKQTDLALRHLGRYLENFPDDREMLFLQASLMADRASGVDALDRVSRMHRQLLFRYPDHPEIGEVRARLADIYIRMSDAYRYDSSRMGIPEQGVSGFRYETAIQLIDQLDQDDPRTQALRGRALEGIGTDGRGVVEAYSRSLELYEQALKRDPDDAEAIDGASDIARRLASFYRDRLDDPGQAEAVLDRLAESRPGSVQPLLIRYSYFKEARDADGARRAIEEARKLAPDDPKVLMVAIDYALVVTGNLNDARDAFEAIPETYRSEHPMLVSLVGGMIDYAERSDDPDPALDQWREGLNLVQGSDAELTWWLAFVLIVEKRFAEADPLIRQFGRLAGGEENPRYRLLVALKDERSGNPQRAIPPLRQLVRDAQNLDEKIRDKAYLALARCYDATNDWREADRIYQDAGRSSPRSSTPVVERARMLERQGRTPEAIRVLSEALNARDDDLDLIRPLIRLRLVEQAGRPPSRRSWAEFDRLVDRAKSLSGAGDDPQRVEMALMLADRDLLDDRPDGAELKLAEALERWPNDPRVRAARAELIKRAGRPREAIELLKEGLATNGDGPTLRIALARSLVALGEGREAQRCLTDDIDRFTAGQRAELWQAVGRLRLSQADYEGARSAFESWREVAPGSPDPLLALVEVALQTDRIPAAELHLDQIKATGSGEENLSYRLALVSIRMHQADRGPASERLGMLEAGGRLVDAVLRDAPELGRAHRIRGRIQEALGEQDEAIEAYQRAWERGDQESFPRLADLLARAGRFDELEELVDSADSEAGRVSALALLAAGQLDRADRMLNAVANDPNAPAVANAWRARMLSLAGRLDELENLQRREAERADPKDPAPWIDLITTQVRLGRSRAALEVTIARALERTAEVPTPLLEAQLRWAAGDVEAADESLEGPLAEEIVDPDLMIGAAMYYQQTGRPDRAEPILERLRSNQSFGSAAALQLSLALSNRSAGDPETWRRAIRLASDGPSDLNRRLAVAIVQSRAPSPEQRAGAIPLFRTLMADLDVMHPRAVEARSHLARLLIELGRTDEAAQVTEISASQPAPSAEALSQHVRALLLADRSAEAGSTLDRLELLRPGDPEVATLRSERLMRDGDGDPEGLKQAVEERLGSPGGNLFARAACLRLLDVGSSEAIEAADQVAEALAEASEAHRWVSALVLATQGRPAEALERCSSSVETVDLTSEIDRVGLTGAILEAVQRAPVSERPESVDRARPIIETMLGKRPGDPDLMIASAMLNHQAGDYRAEAELYRQVLRRRPGDLVALYNFALVLSEGLDRADEALTRIDQVAARVGTNPDVLGARGVILTRLGRFDEAVEALTRAVEIQPSAARHYYLARAYHKAGQDEQFRTHLDRARQAGLQSESIDRWQHDELQRLLAL